MSIQDDIFDVRDALKNDEPMSEAFGRITTAMAEEELENLDAQEYRSAVITLSRLRFEGTEWAKKRDAS